MRVGGGVQVSQLSEDEAMAFNSARPACMEAEKAVLKV